MEGANQAKFSGPSKFKRFTRTVVILLVLILAFCVWFFFFFKYGRGERTGVMVKITTKGNIFQTHEGELWLSCRQVTNPEKFYFSVTSDSLMQVLTELQDECVQLTYTQYKATLPWRGDTRYIVTGVRPITK